MWLNSSEIDRHNAPATASATRRCSDPDRVGRTHACAGRSGRATQDCESPATYRIAWHSCSLAFVRPESNSHHLLIHNGFEKPRLPAITRARLHFRPVILGRSAADISGD